MTAPPACTRCGSQRSKPDIGTLGCCDHIVLLTDEEHYQFLAETHPALAHIHHDCPELLEYVAMSKLNRRHR